MARKAKILSQALVFIWFQASMICPLQATDLLPWYAPMLEVEAQLALQLQAYRNLAVAHHRFVREPACDGFLDLSAATNYYDLAAQIEAVASHCRYRSFGMDCIKATGRYRWMNDIIGDSVSLVTGVSISQVFKPGLRNLSSFHHGGIEGELHVAVGKERSFRQFWTSRYWGVLGVGTADIGSSWIRADVSWEQNYCDIHQMRLFAHSLWGLGGKSLHLDQSFHGYGPIGHQWIDVGFRYSRKTLCSLTIAVEYAYRVLAYNCPAQVNSFYVSLNYPFGL